MKAQEYVAIACVGDTGMAYYVRGLENSSFNWNIDGGSITRNYGDSIIVDWGEVPGEFELTVQEVSEYGCLGEPKSATVLLSSPHLNLGDDVFVCDGMEYTIRPEGNYSTYLWGDGSTAPIYSTFAEGPITLTVSDQYGCEKSDEVFLEVKQPPTIELGNDTSICGDQLLTLDGGMDGVHYTWSTGENSNTITVTEGNQNIWINVEDEYGCISSDSILIENCNVHSFLSDIPSAITPNGDGKNDVWRIDKLQLYPSAVVDIYDRWGNLVFRSEPGYPNAWDGTNMRGNPVPIDSYHYVILLHNENGDRVFGAVTVIR